MRILTVLSVLITMACSAGAIAQVHDQQSKFEEGVWSSQENGLSATRDVLEAELLKLAARSDLELVQVTVNQSAQSGSGKKGSSPVRSTSCTASATVGVPGVGEVTVSATAPTCEEAVSEVISGIETILDAAGDL